jgi:hypothetical protein
VKEVNYPHIGFSLSKLEYLDGFTPTVQPKKEERNETYPQRLGLNDAYV